MKCSLPGINRKISPPNGVVYVIHPQILVLGVQLSLTLFDRCWYSLMLPLLSWHQVQGGWLFVSENWKYCKVSLNQGKITITQNPIIREEIFKLKFPLCLVLGSSRGGRKWFLFSVDRVNVKLLRHLSPWTTDGVAQLLSNENSKRFKKNLNTASFFKKATLLILSLDSLYSTVACQPKILHHTPPFNSNLSYLYGALGVNLSPRILP